MFTRKMKREMVRDWYAGLREEELGAKYKISGRQARAWVADPAFAAGLEELARASAQETRCILARYGTVAAARLVQLLESDKPDVARRAALDMIQAVMGPAAAGPAETAGGDEAEARALLRKLASGFAEADSP